MIISILLALSFAHLHAAEVKLTASDGAAYDYFGYSVSLSGDYAIVGAYKDDSSNYCYKHTTPTGLKTAR